MGEGRDVEVAVESMGVGVASGEDRAETLVGLAPSVVDEPEDTVPVGVELVGPVAMPRIEIADGDEIAVSEAGVESPVLPGGRTVNVGASDCGIAV